jgi:hypothetical protein
MFGRSHAALARERCLAMDPLERDDIERARRTAPGERALQTIDLMRTGFRFRLKRTALRVRYPRSPKTKRRNGASCAPHFNGFAAMRLSVLVTGSMPMPVLSRAATPRIDSASEGPKVTLVTVSDPMKVTRAKP